MRMLTKEQLNKMNEWMQVNARPYDRAKWNYLFNGGSKDAIVEEMLKYQNADGGMGSGFEADVLCPLSAAIPTAEAIFQAYEYDLDCTADWFKTILAYFKLCAGYSKILGGQPQRGYGLSPCPMVELRTLYGV